MAADGLGVKGIVVQFQAVTGGGTVETPQVVTDDAGRATAAVTLGTVSGAQTFEASVSGIPPATFALTALAGAATDLVLVGGDGQTGTVAASLVQPLVVRATDQFGNGVAGVSIDFAVTGGGGSLSAAQVTTDAAGEASVTLQLGTTAGANTIEATLPTVSPLPVVTFTATGTPASPASLEFAVEPSDAIIDAVITPAVGVAVRDQFGNLTTNQANPVSVALGANPGGGSLLGTTQATTVNGIASFGDLSITAAGFGYTLVASTGLLSTTSSAFDILPLGGGSVWVGGDIAALTDWSNPNNWSTRAVPTSSDNVLVPATAPNQPTLSADAFANALTVENGATLNTTGFTITVNGTVDAGTSITGTGTVEVAGTGVTMAGVFPNVTVSGTATALAGTQITGDLTVTGGATSLTLAGVVTVTGAVTATFSEVVLNGNQLTVGGDLSTSGTGAAIVMSQPTDLLVIGGNTSFGGSTPAGGLSAGVIQLAGNFSQVAALTSFVATGTHRVVFAGSGVQTISMANPNPTESHFQEVDVTTPAGLDVTSTVLALGALTTTGTAPVSGAGTFVADGDVTIGGDATLAGLSIGGALTVSGAYSIGTTTFSGAAQTIPASLTYQNLTVTGSAATYAGTSIAGVLAVQGTGASLTVTGDLTVGSNFTVNGDNASGTLGGVTTIPGALTLNGLNSTLTLGGATTVGADLTATLGAVVLNGNQLTVSGNLATVGTGGTVVMTQPTDILVIGGNASFGGSTQANGLSAGEIQLSGDFTQAGSLNGFQASGTHRVVFLGTGVQTISMANPTPTDSRFQELELDQSATVDLATTVLALGSLLVPAVETPTITGSGNVLTVGGLSVDNATFDNALLVSTGGTITTFDNVTFQNMDVAATQLTITHPGAATPFTFTNLAFLTTPIGGLYISATDNLADANTLQIDLVGSTPADGSALTATAGGAIVNWPGAFPGIGTTLPTGRPDSFRLASTTYSYRRRRRISPR